MLSKVISGGQTGADRAALDAAVRAGFPIGGSCPAGRLAEDGPINVAYPLTEINGGYIERTRRNVMDADATAVFFHSCISGGTKETVLHCIRQDKPYKLIDISLVSPEQAAVLIVEFILGFNVSVLNVAGPRASACPLIYAHVKESMSLALQCLR